MNKEKCFNYLNYYINNYFHGNPYSIENLSIEEKNEILNKSLIFLEYDNITNILRIRNTSNIKETITINLNKRTITGSIRINFNSSSNISQFDSFSEYVHNKELIKNILQYTELSLDAGVIDSNKFYIDISKNSKNFDDIEAPIMNLFDNYIEFCTLYNISKNSIIYDKEKLIWIFNSIINLMKINSSFLNYAVFKIEIRGMSLTDNDITPYTKSNIENYIRLHLDNRCKINIKDSSNMSFIRNISNNSEEEIKNLRTSFMSNIQTSNYHN